MTIQPGDPRAGHHQARNTQELLDAADQVGERQEQLYSRDPSTDEIPMPADSREPDETREPASQARTGRPSQQESMAQQSEPMVEPSMDESMTEPAAGPAAAEQADERHGERRDERLERHGERTVQDTDDEHVALFDPREADELQGRWREVQTAFVDDPRSAVQGADQLVAQVIQSLTASFAAHKKELDGQWQGSDTSGPATEDLRLALRRYRTLFNQLLNT